MAGVRRRLRLDCPVKSVPLVNSILLRQAGRVSVSPGFDPTPAIHRLTRFGFVGVATAAIHVLTGTALWYITGVGKVTASNLAFLVAITFNYVAHKSWSFRNSTPHRFAIAKYLSAIGSSLAINTAIVHVGSELLAWHYILVQSLAMSALVPWNFVVFSLWVFRSDHAYRLPSAST